MTERPALAVILAAGKGTRMKSELPKVMHPLAGAPMIAHVLAAVRDAGIVRQALVVAAGMDAVETAAKRITPGVETFIQREQRGTADAVLAARDAFTDFAGDVFVLFGDTPLLTADAIRATRASLDGADLIVVGFEPEVPTGYGRLLQDSEGRLLAIREEKDANEQEQKVRLCNSGIMGFRGETLAGLLGRIGCANANNEFYLTDAVAIARADGLTMRTVTRPAPEVQGVNSRSDLAKAEADLQERLRRSAMAEGATLIAPETVFFSHDTRLGRDVVVEPNVVFGPGVEVEDGVTIKAFSHLEGARVRSGAVVGPYARLRPGAEIGENAHVGNFVEIKNAELERGAKVNHLTYIGDARVGEGANVGAGTITCNYDGYDKHRTDIGAGAFIGSNSSLVAPVKIGKGAYVGSGSVISRDVADDALALTRADQTERPEWAAKVRARRGRKRAS